MMARAYAARPKRLRRIPDGYEDMEAEGVCYMRGRLSGRTFNWWVIWPNGKRECIGSLTEAVKVGRSHYRLSDT